MKLRLIVKEAFQEIFIRHDREGARSAAEAREGGAGIDTPALYNTNNQPTINDNE